MSKGPAYFFRKAFRFRKEMSLGFYFADFLFRKILRQNSGTTWAVHHTATIHCPQNITRGKNVFPGDSPGVYIDATNGVRIGDYTNIGPNVGIISSNHDFINNDIATIAAPVEIGNFCWMGFGAVILPGIRLGNFTIVGANTVVTKSFPEGYCVIAGNPAKLIKYLNKTECETFAESKK